jgi:hypothetical protein
MSRGQGSGVRDQGSGISSQASAVTGWTYWLLPLLLAAHVVFCHGCHRDEDNELRFRAPGPANEVGRQGQPGSLTPDS